MVIIGPESHTKNNNDISLTIDICNLGVIFRQQPPLKNHKKHITKTSTSMLHHPD